jgi:hypothetical protein
VVSQDLSEELAAAAVKKYVSELRHVVALADLVHDETEKVYAHINSGHFPVTGATLTYPEIEQRVRQFESSQQS